MVSLPRKDFVNTQEAAKVLSVAPALSVMATLRSAMILSPFQKDVPRKWGTTGAGKNTSKLDFPLALTSLFLS